MICDNCGATIDSNEEFCNNCGMQLLDMRPKKKKRYYKKSRSFDNSSSFDKPIKQRYIKNSKPESYDYPQYLDDEEYAYSGHDHEKDHERKSGTGIGSIILLLLIALALGFTVGLIMFTSQLIPQIPGLNN